MTRRLSHGNCTALALLWSCVALFGARVLGQLEALLIAPDWLPDMDAWYSGLMPYYLLLPAQIALLMLMSVVAWNRRIRSGAFARANPRAAGALRLFALLYFTVMAVRLGVNLIDNGAEFRREGAIPVAFHWVLALFVLVSGRMPAEDGHQHEVADDVPHGDVPALPQPLAHGLRLGEDIRYGHTG
jgi:hypothetical protein